MKNLGVNVFETRKAKTRFMDIRETLPTKLRTTFVEKVNQLFDKKVTSDEGEFDCFKITEEDLNKILQSMLA